MTGFLFVCTDKINKFRDGRRLLVLFCIKCVSKFLGFRKLLMLCNLIDLLDYSWVCVFLKKGTGNYCHLSHLLISTIVIFRLWGMPLGLSQGCAPLCVFLTKYSIESLGELFDLEKLSQTCAETGRYTFFFSSWPLNM